MRCEPRGLLARDSSRTCAAMPASASTRRYPAHPHAMAATPFCKASPTSDLHTSPPDLVMRSLRHLELLFYMQARVSGLHRSLDKVARAWLGPIAGCLLQAFQVWLQGQ